MKKIKYQGGVTKLITRKLGEVNKLRFARQIENNFPNLLAVGSQKPITLDVVSFSSSRDFYDQVISILSFLRHVGRPNSWLVYSDGTHDQKQIEQLSHFNFLTVKIVKSLQSEVVFKNELLPYKKALLDYAEKFPLGKKLMFYLNHPIEKPTLFLDSDILFYAKAADFHFLIQENVNGWFLPDAEWGCLDSRYKDSCPVEDLQVNSGLFLLKKELSDYGSGLDFLESLGQSYEYFTEQTVFHILFNSNRFAPLDKDTFILNSADQFDFSYLYEREKMAVRHYTGPVRHKIWQKNWKWQLSLS